MKLRWLLLLVVMAVICPAVLHAEVIVKPGARVAIIGDSITEQKMYSRYIELYLVACQPQLNVRVMQFGWGGETAGGFARRMDNDLLPFKPTLMTTCYGMNDGGYRAFEPGIGKNYETPLRDIVKRGQAAGATVLVGSPGVVDSKTFRGGGDPATVYNDNLAHLRDIAKQVAADNGMPFANVHDAMMDAMVKAKAALGETFDVAGGDGVHPNADGQLVMAYAFLKGMGFDGDLGAITVDMKGAATATGGHKVLTCKDGTVELESTQYPFCFYGDGKSSNSTRAILPYVPFNQDLNRLTLVVKNLGAEKAKVTWGQSSKEFTRAQLETGINLAAEFLDNPFNAPFQQVESAVSNKQNYETFMIKSQINAYPGMLKMFNDDPEVAAALTVLRTKLWARETKLQDDVRAAVQPVKHTLTITAVQ